MPLLLGVQTCALPIDRKSTRLNSSHQIISYAVFCLKKKSTPLNSSHQIISYAVFCLKEKHENSRINAERVLRAEPCRLEIQAGSQHATAVKQNPVNQY